ncbi:hypothetical protein MRX96_009309 [Rhipicephalus microplus]
MGREDGHSVGGSRQGGAAVPMYAKHRVVFAAAFWASPPPILELVMLSASVDCASTDLGLQTPVPKVSLRCINSGDPGAPRFVGLALNLSNLLSLSVHFLRLEEARTAQS